jgi:hypothetical protein
VRVVLRVITPAALLFKFTYFVVTAVMWLVVLSRGWTIFSVLTFALLVLFALGFGYFTLLRRPSAQPVMQ